MANCHGCGGVIGRDCFNPQECEWITRDMAARYQDGRAEMEFHEREWYAEQEREFFASQEADFEADRFEATAAGVA